jgi:hypothetical protein
VAPFAAALLSAGVTLMATPLAGVAEFTVNEYVVGSTGAEGAEDAPPPLPHALRPSARQVPREAAMVRAPMMSEEAMGY